MKGLKTIRAFTQEKGALREDQEDFYGVSDDGRFFVLADGLGGQPHGEIAAKLAIELSLMTYRLMEYRRFYRWRAFFVKQVIKKANLGIFKKVRKTPELLGMATTLVDLFLSSKQWTIGNVGDSRAYILSRGNFRQITVNHKGGSGVLTKVVGLEKKIVPDSFEGQIYSGDLFLLCSDGLTDRLTNEEIYKVLKSCGQEKEDLEDAAKRLLFSANKVGPGENTTVCLIKAKEEGKLLPKWQRQSLELHIAPGKKLKILPTS